jgi:hypothetical protein
LAMIVPRTREGKGGRVTLSLPGVTLSEAKGPKARS